MAKKKNRNIVLIKNIDELENEINFSNLKYKEHFSHLCNLIPNKDKEKLELENIDNNRINDTGLVYAFVIKDKIFKIGSYYNKYKKTNTIL